MSTDFLAYLREQVEVLEDDADVTEVLGNLLEEQFTGFEANLTRYLESEGPTFARRVRTILEPLAFLADDLHLRELAIRVESLDRRLREQ
jgi:hypothetical protein